MTDRDPRCVMVVEEHTTAAALAEFLIAKGFPAEVVQGGPIGQVADSLGFNETPPPGLEVRVVDVAKAEDARKLLAEQTEAVRQARAAAQRRAERTGTVTATCEECGKSSDWPAAAMGTTEYCPHCAAYMDIPDPEENWDDADFGEGAESEEDAPDET
jgi:hypothetical protein